MLPEKSISVGWADHSKWIIPLPLPVLSARSTRFPAPVLVISVTWLPPVLLKKMSWNALSVSVLLLDQLMGAFTMMSPAPPSEFVFPVVPGGPLGGPLAKVCKMMLVDSRSLEIVPAAVESIMRSVGSSSQVPVVPAGADVFTTAPVKFSTPWLDVSTNPPLPLAAPPCARMVPAKRGLLIRPQHHLAAIAAAGRRGIDDGGGVDAHRGGGRDRKGFKLGQLDCGRGGARMAAAGIAADQHAAAAGVARGVDGGAGEHDVLPRHHHGAAGRAFVLAGGRDLARELDGLGRRAGSLAGAGGGAEHDLAAASADRVRLDHALVVDDGIDHCPRGRGGELDAAAIGAELAGIADQRFEGFTGLRRP